ncbi:MAG TPA: DUF4159 domain-containing protein [Rhizomicrobium sp.]|nr:DUF4159 domain-containing protein [Rhizomicrobium sp.]
MMNLFAGLSFASPLILLGLLVLPAIWFLLRITPPSPRKITFPPLRLLLGLRAREETPARTPWWLLLLRLLAAALLILALAEPIFGEPPAAPGKGPLVLFVDNGWPAAHAWKDRQAAMNDALAEAARANRPVALVPTASATQDKISLLDAGKAERAARELQPQSWLPDRAKVLAELAKTKFAARPQILWLSDGLDYGAAKKTAAALAKIGTLKIYSDAQSKGPLALRPQSDESNGFKITIIRSQTAGPRKGQVHAFGAHSQDLGGAEFAFADGKTSATADIRMPPQVRNETKTLTITNAQSAGAIRLLDSSSKRRSVGLVSASNEDGEQPLLSDLYYLQRALGPYADLHKGTVEAALAKHVQVLVLADIGKITGANYGRVEKFVDNGGVLIRFAGERMAAHVDDLIPVKLRTGGRYLGGALAWAEPQHLAPFPETSPFRGLKIPAEVTVSREVLAEPSVDLSDRSWARLKDGTPLVTAVQKGKGWIVLFHVTAGPAWSSLPLSGLYVDMLRRLTDLAGGAHPNDLGTDANAVFPPLMTMDGFGHLQKPPADVLPIRGSELAKAKPSPAHPPGLYGAEGGEIALNAVAANDSLVPMRALDTPIAVYAGTQSLALQPPLLAIALLIILGDALISLWLRGYLAHTRRISGGAAALLFAVLLIQPQHARADESFDMKAALDTRLAYVKTGLSDVDNMSRAGLEGLGRVLAARTSYEPKEPVGVDVAHDDLSFFPLLYWPMDPREADLSPDAISKLTDYMRSGGTILFDTRDLTLGATRGADSPGQQTLRRLLSKLDIPPLEPVPPDHVLRRTFYLLDDFPGRWDGGKVWVQAIPPRTPDMPPAPARGGDGVSPIIIGGNDWAAAWAVDSNGQPLVAVVPGGERQREMAYRFGVNVVMYALTGNYKADQVHVPALLERLGEEP